MRTSFKTSDLFFWQAVFAVVVSQFLLCYDAMTCRGFPPMTETELNKLLLSPVFAWIPAVFGNRVDRMRGVLVMTVSLTFCLTMVYIDDGVCPSTGSLAGPIGIIQDYFIGLLFMTAISAPFVFFPMYFFERVTGDIWRFICFRPTENLTFKETWERAWGRERATLRRS